MQVRPREHRPSRESLRDWNWRLSYEGLTWVSGRSRFPHWEEDANRRKFSTPSGGAPLTWRTTRRIGRTRHLRLPVLRQTGGYPETGFWEVPKSVSKMPTRVNSLRPNPRLLIALHSPNALPQTGLRMCLPEKSRTLTAFGAEQSVLCSPVCLGIIAKYGHFLRISEEVGPTFSAVQTTWRRERDSNPRYSFAALSLDISVSCR
jgi:hypothetical protein